MEEMHPRAGAGVPAVAGQRDRGLPRSARLGPADVNGRRFPLTGPGAVGPGHLGDFRGGRQDARHPHPTEPNGSRPIVAVGIPLDGTAEEFPQYRTDVPDQSQ